MSLHAIGWHPYNQKLNQQNLELMEFNLHQL